MTQRLTILGAAVAALVCLSGCGDDRPAYRPPAPATGAYQSAAPALPAVTPTAGDDPLAAPDPLAGGGDPAPAPGPAGDDPLAAPERPMPTDHSHWLTGSVFNARVAVSLNGLPLGEFRAPVDRDITMRLRRGVNTVAFTYTPVAGGASARLDVREGEHHPPAPPLASFHQSPAVPVMGGAAPRPVTQAYTFIAR